VSTRQPYELVRLMPWCLVPEHLPGVDMIRSTRPQTAALAKLDNERPSTNRACWLELTRCSRSDANDHQIANTILGPHVKRNARMGSCRLASKPIEATPKWLAVRNLLTDCHVSVANRPASSQDRLLRDDCYASRITMPLGQRVLEPLR
jgi:hypothetical protein